MDRSGLSRLFKQIRHSKPLSRERERELAAEGSLAARDELVRSNLAYVVALAREYSCQGLSFEDLVHEGSVGLLEAARRFDGDKGVKFITYARWWIRREILRAMAEHASLVTVPDHRRRMLARFRREREALERREGRKLALEEIGKLSSRTMEEVARIREVEHREVRIDEAGGEDEGLSLSDRLADPSCECVEQGLIRSDLARRLRKALSILSDRQLRVLSGRFGLGGEPEMTLRQVGDQEGISRERTRQIEAESLRRLARTMRRLGVESTAAGQRACRGSRGVELRAS